MSDEARIATDDLRTLLFYAIRYALGRHTYAVGDVQRMTRQHVEVLTPRDRRQLAEEIDVFLTDSARAEDDPIDGPRWHRLADWLRDV